MYAKIIDNETKTVSVAIGTNISFYESIGMTLMDVEQGYDGNWYVKGYAPIQPLEEKIKITYKEYNKNIEDMLDNFARTREYKDIESVCSYYNSINEKFRNEAIYCSRMRDEIYTKCYELLNEYLPKIESDEIEIPTWEEIKNLLPELKWPDEI